MDVASVFASCLTEHVDRAVRLMAEVVRTPTFPAAEFKKLRRQVRTELAVSSGEPAYLADRQFRRAIFGNHPYARTATGEIEDLDALKVVDARQWWQRFARPDMAVLIFAGDINLDKAKSLAEEHFGGWTAHGPTPKLDPPPVPKAEATRIVLLDRPGVQSQIRIGCPLDFTRRNPAYFNSIVVSSYFGGAFSSRLNETVRVKKGLTYGASGGYDIDRLGGAFRAGTFSKTARTAEAVRAVLDEVKRLGTEIPTAEELAKTKSYTLGSFPRQRETPDRVAADLWLIESCGLPADYLQQLLKGVNVTSAEDCTRVVANTIEASKLTIVVVGPAAELLKDLEQIAPVTVVAAKNQPTTEPE